MLPLLLGKVLQILPLIWVNFVGLSAALRSKTVNVSVDLGNWEFPSHMAL